MTFDGNTVLAGDTSVAAHVAIHEVVFHSTVMEQFTIFSHIIGIKLIHCSQRMIPADFFDPQNFLFRQHQVNICDKEWKISITVRGIAMKFGKYLRYSYVHVFRKNLILVILTFHFKLSLCQYWSLSDTCKTNDIPISINLIFSLVIIHKKHSRRRRKTVFRSQYEK